MTKRREFSKPIVVEIIRRATVGMQVRCEGCGVACRTWQVDHIVAEALVIDKSKKLTAADGQLLCAECHKAKTGTADVPAIARAVRREAKHTGASRPAGNIPSPPKPAPKRPAREPVQGVTNLARRFR
jgi:5-methylcytosine-specific restriction endonuclease McrA